MTVLHVDVQAGCDINVNAGMVGCASKQVFKFEKCKVLTIHHYKLLSFI